MGSFIPFPTFKGMGSALCATKIAIVEFLIKAPQIGTDLDYVMHSDVYSSDQTNLNELLM